MTNDLATTNQSQTPLEGQVVTRAAPGALAQTDQQRAIAEVQAAMMIARANPRDQRTALDRILNACQRPKLAEAALYSYSRGGAEISGPSIRLAEALAQNWGNIQFGIREIEQRGDESTVQAFAWDVETNVKREMVFTVRHVRHTRQGSYKLNDPRDIYEMVANNGARRLRSCILAVIPGDIIDEAVEQVDATMRAKADTSPEAIQKMVVAFQDFGVSQHQIETRIQRRLSSIQPAQVVALKKIYTSLRDGMSAPADWFEPVEAEGDDSASGNAKAKAALKAATNKESQGNGAAVGTGSSGDQTAAGATASSPAAQSDDKPARGKKAQAPKAEDEQQTGEDEIGVTKHPAEAKAEQLLADMARVENIIDLDKLYGKAEADIAAMPDDVRGVVDAAYTRHTKRLSPAKAEAAEAGAK